MCKTRTDRHEDNADDWSTLMREFSGSGLEEDGTANPEITRITSRTHLTQTFLCVRFEILTALEVILYSMVDY
jgi:hypothetical protein